MREQVQANPTQAIRTSAGEPVQRFTPAQWEQLTWRLGYTTIFDVLALVLAPFDTPDDAELAGALLPDPAKWYADVLGIINALAVVHESYVVKVIGPEAYQQFVALLPNHLQDGFVQERMAGILQVVEA